ncbi:MAG: NUDIX hydrolase [Paracoccaceae bacterium]|nr:NUDIX hydrolase [Paracoccaceae bacterium]
MKSLKKVIRKTGRGTQYAALCFRVHKKRGCEILLVTSRGTRRWIPPKGWPMPDTPPHESAAIEALEEAGVAGAVLPYALDRYKYHRPPGDRHNISHEAYIFPLRVTRQHRNFKEKGQRRVKWFSQKRAAKMVREPKLKKIIRNFDPNSLPRDGWKKSPGH